MRKLWQQNARARLRALMEEVRESLGGSRDVSQIVGTMLHGKYWKRIEADEDMQRLLVLDGLNESVKRRKP